MYDRTRSGERGIDIFISTCYYSYIVHSDQVPGCLALAGQAKGDEQMARHMWMGKAARKARHDDALRLQEERKLRSPQQQIIMLDRRLGVGQGAAKERARLMAKIAAV